MYKTLMLKKCIEDKKFALQTEFLNNKHKIIYLTRVFLMSKNHREEISKLDHDNSIFKNLQKEIEDISKYEGIELDINTIANNSINELISLFAEGYDEYIKENKDKDISENNFRTLEKFIALQIKKGILPQSNLQFLKELPCKDNEEKNYIIKIIYIALILIYDFLLSDEINYEALTELDSFLDKIHELIDNIQLSELTIPKIKEYLIEYKDLLKNIEKFINKI